MKRLLGSMVSCAVLTILAVLPPLVAYAEEITVLTWGGAWEEGARAVVEQFERQSNVKVRLETQQNVRFGLAKIKAQKADPQVDVWFNSPDTSQEATDEGLFQSLSAREMPRFAALPPVARHPTWMDVGHTTYGILYRPDLVPFDLRTLADLLDPRLRGKVVLPTATYASGLWISYLALLNGGNERNVEPAFEYLRRLKPNIARISSTGADAMKFLNSREAAVFAFALASIFRQFVGIESPYRFVVLKDPSFATTYTLAIPSPKHKAQAMQFIDFLATPEAQTAYCAKAVCTPTNPAARPPQGFEAFRPNLDNLYQPDLSIVNKSLPAWDDRFKKEIQTR